MVLIFMNILLCKLPIIQYINIYVFGNQQIKDSEKKRHKNKHYKEKYLKKLILQKVVKQ